MDITPEDRQRAANTTTPEERERVVDKIFQEKAAHRRAEKPPDRPANQKSNKRKTKRVLRDHYSVDSYRKCVQRACQAAGIPTFSLHAIRHRAATTIRKQFGLEAAQLI